MNAKLMNEYRTRTKAHDATVIHTYAERVYSFMKALRKLFKRFPLGRHMTTTTTQYIEENALVVFCLHVCV